MLLPGRWLGLVLLFFEAASPGGTAQTGPEAALPRAVAAYVLGLIAVLFFETPQHAG